MYKDKVLRLRIDDNLKEEFRQACDNEDMSKVLLQLIKGYIQNSKLKNKDKTKQILKKPN
jgi:antitoxin component of RelBE/YafQ-DinJ toxin-antitoxin module